MATLALDLPRRWWRRRRSRRLLIQAAFGAFLALLLWYLAWRASRLPLDLNFMREQAGFAISHQWLTSFTGNEDRWAAFSVGVANTLRLVTVGLVLATIVGVVVGVARLSTNWLLSRLATGYVEVFRNTPLLIQLIFWYTAVLLQLPPFSRGVEVFGAFFLSNRALAVPWAYPDEGFSAWLVVLAVAVLVALGVRRWRARLEDSDGAPRHPNATAAITFLALAIAGAVALGGPMRLEIPQASGGVESASIRTLGGGMAMTAEFAALMFALVIYTGAFIAEIVRGSIQALPRGQTEAAMALGLSGYQRLTLVILPQALRIGIPPATNQYLNLTKNSSLAVAIGYPDLVFVARTIQNNSGHAVPMFLVVMTTYLAMSLVIAVLMNALNRRVQLVAR